MLHRAMKTKLPLLFEFTSAALALGRIEEPVDVEGRPNCSRMGEQVQRLKGVRFTKMRELLQESTEHNVKGAAREPALPFLDVISRGLVR